MSASKGTGYCRKGWGASSRAPETEAAFENRFGTNCDPLLYRSTMRSTQSWSLVDRYLEFRHWPTSRKTALLMGIAFAAQIPLTVAAVLLMDRSDLIGDYRIGRIGGIGVAICALITAVGWLLDRAGREGKWTAYLVVLLYGGWLLWLLGDFGLWVTPLIAWGPAVLILITLWYDHRVGLFATVYWMAGQALLVGLITQGHKTFAPAIAMRGLDAQNSLTWALAMLLPALGFLFYTLALTLLTVLTRNRQESRLSLAHQMIRRYAPAQVADRILSGDHVEGAPAERRKLTIFFSDIVGFTTTSDQLDPEDLSALLDDYLDEMAQVAERYDTSINQFLGDGILVFFGAPHEIPLEEGAFKAVQMALEMQERIAHMGERWRRKGIPTPLSVRIGIHTGYASVGDFGSKGRKVYTAIGMQANVAARIQAQCEPGKILLSDTTHALVTDKVQTIDRGALQVKGVHYPVPVHEVVALV